MKQLHLLYRGAALAVALGAVQSLCQQGDAEAALLYLYLVSHDGAYDPAQTAHDLQLSPENVDRAVRTLAAAGAVEPADLEPVSAPAPAPVPVPDPYYTRAELSGALKKDTVFAWLVADTERCIGRALRQHETEKLFLLYDNVRLPAETIPLLVRHVGGVDPARDGLSFARLLTVGRQWAERGVHSVEDAERLIAADAQRQSLCGQLLAAAGVHGRAPSPTERRYAAAWADAGYSPALVERAYDITVTKTGGVNWKYTSAILSRWKAKGIRTPEDVEHIEGARRSYYHAKNTAVPAADEEEALYARLRENYLRELAEEEKQS